MKESWGKNQNRTELGGGSPREAEGKEYVSYLFLKVRYTFTR